MADRRGQAVVAAKSDLMAAVPDQKFHPVSAFAAKHVDRPGEGIVAQNRLHDRRKAVGATTEIDRPGRYQHPHARRWDDHPSAFSVRSTSASSAGSTPGDTRTRAPESSISIAAARATAR